jgi:hypothetical protein
MRTPDELIPHTKRYSPEGLTLEFIKARKTLQEAPGDVELAKAQAYELGRLLHIVHPDTGLPHLFDEDVIERLTHAATPKKASDEVADEIADAIGDAIYAGQQSPLRAVIASPLQKLDQINAEIEELALTRMKRARAEALARQWDAEDEGEDEGEDYADVASIIAHGVEQRTPDAGGVRNDGVRLAYSGAVNGLVGPPESGKTLVAVAQASDELKAGGRVLHIDADHNGPQATIGLYLSFGVDRDVLADPERFRYVDVRSAEHVRRVVADAADWSPTFVPVDSIGEIVPLFGGDSNSNDDYRRIHREILTPLTRAGAAVLVLDHEAKANGPGGYAIGASAKKAAIDGSYLAVSAVEPFTPGQGGAAALSILKDRFGGLRAESPGGKNPSAAVFRLDSRGGSSTWEFWRGRTEDERAGEQVDADVAFVLALPEFPASRTVLQAAVKAAHDGKGWGNDRAHAALTSARARRDAQATTFPLSTPNE